ncbi:MAG: VOC family protein [Bacteroidetes bacterium]|nr:VOC family protein [Bacteroidota bacterium]
MSNNREPDYGNGKICYLEIPAKNVSESATFFEKVFNWSIRKNNSGHTAFDDGVGQVSGMWVLGRKPMTEVGIVISIMVDDAEATVEAIKANGCKIIQPIGMDAPEITARFTDPAGNIFGIYQHRG